MLALSILVAYDGGALSTSEGFLLRDRRLRQYLMSRYSNSNPTVAPATPIPAIAPVEMVCGLSAGVESTGRGVMKDGVVDEVEIEAAGVVDVAKVVDLDGELVGVEVEVV